LYSTHAELKHNKPFEMGTKIKERRLYQSHLGAAHQIKERKTKRGTIRGNYLHVVMLIVTENDCILEGMKLRGPPRLLR